VTRKEGEISKKRGSGDEEVFHFLMKIVRRDRPQRGKSISHKRKKKDIYGSPEEGKPSQKRGKTKRKKRLLGTFEHQMTRDWKWKSGTWIEANLQGLEGRTQERIRDDFGFLPGADGRPRSLLSKGTGPGQGLVVWKSLKDPISSISLASEVLAAHLSPYQSSTLMAKLGKKTGSPGVSLEKRED